MALFLEFGKKMNVNCENIFFSFFENVVEIKWVSFLESCGNKLGLIFFGMF